MAAVAAVDGFLQPWRAALANPATAQETILRSLLAVYAQTEYGSQHGAGQIGSLEEYRKVFPVMTYEDYKPLIQRVMAGETRLLLNEEPVGWAITRGTTGDEKKFIPMTPSDLRMRVQAGRAMMAYVAASKRFDLFRGVNLNLNFPSVVGTLHMGDRELSYGYSSGIYTKYVSHQTPIRSLPTQEDIDTLGGGSTVRDWEARFELAYRQCQGQNVTLVGGVAPTTLRFALYLHKHYGHYPRELWKTQVMTLGSVPGINTHRLPALRDLYGHQAVIREIYGATEGMFGQQMDEKRAWVPNYDLFLLEVQVGSQVKLLHQMQPGETGSLIASTLVLPRYKIGDLVRAFTPPYFRCLGRERWTTPWQYAWRELVSLNLDQI
jgi:hypothetical protein